MTADGGDDAGGDSTAREAAAGGAEAAASGEVSSGADVWARADRIAERVTPPTFPDREFDVTEYGAAGDGETDCTDAFDEAIAACTAAGGGRVLVPEGTYHTGAVHLEDGVELHLAEGSRLAFSRDPADYLPVVRTRWEGTELYNYSPMIYAEGVKRVGLTGAGTVDGRANQNHWWPWCGMETFGAAEERPDQGRDQPRLEGMAARGVPVEDRRFGEGHYLRPNLVQFYDCTDVLVSGVTLTGSPMWMCHPVLSENVTVEGITVRGRGPNHDGVDPESCRDVVIRDCTLDAGDDAVAVKSGREADGRRVGVPCENVLVEDCAFPHKYGAITVGSEVSGGARNIFARNCTGGSDGLYFGLYVKTNARRGGFVEDVHLKGVHLETVVRQIVSCDFHRGAGDAGAQTPHVEGLSLEDVTVEDARDCFEVAGFDRSPIRDLTLRDCSFEDVSRFGLLENAELTVENVTVRGERCDSEADLRAVFDAD